MPTVVSEMVRWGRSRRCCLDSLLAPALLLLAAVGCSGDRVHPPDTRLQSVVLIVIDTLRADHLGLYGYERQTSPNLDAWAQHGSVFERAWATSSWTLPSLGSILTGRIPGAHGAGLQIEERADAEVETEGGRQFLTLHDGAPTLAEMLAAEGFATGAFVTNPLLDPRFGLARGFDDYDHYDTSNSEHRPAAEVVDLSLDWLDDNEGQPVFLLVHLFEPHLDYDAPPPYRGQFTRLSESELQLPLRGAPSPIAEMTKADREFIVAAYDEEIAYVDAEVGRFLDGLAVRGMMREALVVLTSDHGEEFFEHDGFEHGHSMYEEVLRVPLILWGPQVVAGRVDVPVSLIDLVPTILDATGMRDGRETTTVAAGDPLPRESTPQTVARWPGVSLLASGQGSWKQSRTIVAEQLLYGPETKAIVSWPYKAILELDSGEAMLFNLQEDPAETRDRSTEAPDKQQELLAHLGERMAEATPGTASAAAEIHGELFSRLQELGYVR